MDRIVKEVKFGDWVAFQERYRRCTLHKPGEVRKVWKPFVKYGEGIYLGTRTLQNGDLVWLGDEEGYHLNPTERIRVAYVSPGPRANPVYVPLDKMGLMI